MGGDKRAVALRVESGFPNPERHLVEKRWLQPRCCLTISSPGLKQNVPGRCRGHSLALPAAVRVRLRAALRITGFYKASSPALLAGRCWGGSAPARQGGH